MAIERSHSRLREAGAEVGYDEGDELANIYLMQPPTKTRLQTPLCKLLVRSKGR